LDLHGYIRAGSGTSTQGGEMAAFQLPGAGSKYRLGNEAEDYGEFSLDAQVYQQAGTTFKAHIMANFLHPFQTGSQNVGVGSSGSQRDFDMNQYWVEGIGLLGDSAAFAKAGLWAGKRYYNRNENHIEITDFFYWNDYGNGFGLENVELGFAKAHYAYLQYDNTNNLSAATVPDSQSGQNVVTAHAFRLSDWHVNPGGSLELGVTLKKARPYSSVMDASNSNNGLELNLQHKQAGILGGDNLFGLQYGNGSASTLDQPPGGNPALARANRAWRVVDCLTLERNARFALQAVGLYQETRDAAGVRSTWTSFGGRPMLFVTRNLSVVADAGLDRVKYPAGSPATAAAGGTGQLVKATLAVVWRPEPRFWSVPQFRLFVSNARWNDAAAAAGTIANGTFGTRKSGTNYGLQGEVWW
jgi:maltoporin